jgi:ubiquinone/menaquinone biosynthesis C-methylase UbiE
MASRSARVKADDVSDGASTLLERGTTDHYVDPALYDFEYRHHVADIAWYRELAQAWALDRDILELGAGTGRVTLALADDGHSMTALEPMASMRDALTTKLRLRPRARVRVVDGDMRAIPLDDASVRMVIAPFNALMHLYTWQDLLACFREVARVLEPDGTFALDVLMPDLEWLRLDPDKRHCVTRFTHPTTGEKLVYSTNHVYDHATQICHVRIYYDTAPGRGRFRASAAPKAVVHLAHRQIWPEELRALVAWAGLELVSHTGEFDGRRIDGTVETQALVARKPRR